MTAGRPPKHDAPLTLERLEKLSEQEKPITIHIVLIDSNWYLFATVPGTPYAERTCVLTDRGNTPNTMVADRLFNLIMKVVDKCPLAKLIIEGPGFLAESAQIDADTADLMSTLREATPLGIDTAASLLGISGVKHLQASILHAIKYMAPVLGNVKISAALGALQPKRDKKTR